MDTSTDCRSEEGITVGLCDSLIAIARVLAKRDLTHCRRAGGPEGPGR